MKPLSRMSRLAVIALPGMLLMACANYSHVPAANQLNMQGDSFNKELARNYRDLANYEAYEMHDWRDAIRHADNSMAVNRGMTVNPDDLSNRRIRGNHNIAELRTARTHLMQALNDGAAQRTPANVALAQAKFDCWAEQQEEGHQPTHIAACKDGFWSAMRATELAMAPAPAPRAAAPQVAQPAAPQVAQPSSYRVFFDWDKSELTADARQVIDQALERSRISGQNIHLTGHTDSSGPDAYNFRLSQRRADAVRRYLTGRGVTSSIITSEARGQRDALVKTADGVREAQNRNVSIELLSRISASGN